MCNQCKDEGSTAIHIPRGAALAPTPTPTSKPSETEQEIDLIKSGLVGLDELISYLQKKLGPVISEEISLEMPPVDAPARVSRLASELQSFSSRIYQKNIQLDNLINRIQL